MKFLLSVCLFLLFTTSANAQNLTIILVRHAEKDTSPAMNPADPNLSPEGRKRAAIFFETVKKYGTRRIFSTNLRRTRLTAEPLATNQNEKFRIFVEAYDPKDLPAFAKFLVNLKAKCIVVVGHSNTTPRLANLLIKQEKYKDLDDAVYNKIFIIRIRGKKISEEVIEY